jgi:hypothetical protein
MRIASSPTLRVAAGLPLVALLSIVGYQVFRLWISHGLEGLLERADDLSWPVNWDLVAGPAYRAEATTHLTKPALIGSVPNNGPSTCATIGISNRILNGKLESAVGPLPTPQSPFERPCAEHLASELRMPDLRTNRSTRLRTRALPESGLA